MDNKFAILLGIILVLAAGWDYSQNNSEYLLLWGREWLKLVHWIAFWR